MLAPIGMILTTFGLIIWFLGVLFDGKSPAQIKYDQNEVLINERQKIIDENMMLLRKIEAKYDQASADKIKSNIERFHTLKPKFD